jgi:hypothetical protein
VLFKVFHVTCALPQKIDRGVVVVLFKVFHEPCALLYFLKIFKAGITPLAKPCLLLGVGQSHGVLLGCVIDHVDLSALALDQCTRFLFRNS